MIGTYELRRIEELRKLKAKGASSMRWFEDLGVYADNLTVDDFEKALLSRASGPENSDAKSTQSNAG